jgi:hypothetical protein
VSVRGRDLTTPSTPPPPKSSVIPVCGVFTGRYRWDPDKPNVFDQVCFEYECKSYFGAGCHFDKLGPVLYELGAREQQVFCKIDIVSNDLLWSIAH